MSDATQFDLLRCRRFLPLFLTQFANAFNDYLFKSAVLVLLSLTAANASTLLNLCAGLFILPFFLFSALAGQLADRYDKARLARIIKASEIAIMGVGALGFVTGTSGLLILCIFLMGTHSTFFGPVKYALLPQHLTTEELIGGNGLVDMGTFLAILAGTIFGGAMIGIDHGSLAVSIAVVATAFAGYAVSRTIPPAPAPAPYLIVDWNLLRSTATSLRLISVSRTAVPATLGITWFYVLGATYLTQMPLYVKDVLGGREGTMTLLLTLFSAGIGVGSVLCERLSGRKIEPGLVPFGAIGLLAFGCDLTLASPAPWSGALRSIVAVVSDPAVPRVMVDLFGVGVFGGFFAVPLFALIQHRSKPEERARIVAANNIINAAGMVLAAGTGIGLLSALHWTVPQVYLLFALLNLPAALGIFMLQPEFMTRFKLWIGR